MNVLIVDDNANNRIILRLLLEDYEEDTGTKFEIQEAKDGQEAVNKCEKDNFDIVLMDILMPNMDGIQATKLIREQNNKIMIIAVSAVDDSERKKDILNNGAEDYIIKPVNADVFRSRIQNYVTLIEARAHKKNNTNNVNLFTTEVFSRYTNFMINSEDSISEFWEFFLLNITKKNNNLSDVVRAIFSIAEAQIKLSIDANVVIEESEEKQYFTLTDIDKLPKKIIELIVIKNGVLCEYKIETSKISFELEKVYIKDEEEVSNQASNVQSVVLEEKDEEIASSVEYKSLALEVFDYLDSEDLVDLEEYAAKLNSLMLIVGSGNVTSEEVQEIYSYLEKLGSILSSYSEVFVISKALKELSYDMSNNELKFIENSEILGRMCAAFSNDMLRWIQMSFHTGAPSIDFMNDTIVVNCETIGSMLKLDESVSNVEDLDDIFDF
ncbi:response regulator [Sulfurimonas sp.]|uniref:response regulator n=1 Tax=Sulfurimonas sp. TaxID=2022749 RepID=UPI002AAFF44C|nr:response regulator [Sulfurimonas sp.]